MIRPCRRDTESSGMRKGGPDSGQHRAVGHGMNTMSRETVLREFLKLVKGSCDAIVLDTMPSLGMLTINALAAADEVIIPTSSQYLSIKGLEQLLRTIAKVHRQINPL